jgi:hypothetical protein
VESKGYESDKRLRKSILGVDEGVKGWKSSFACEAVEDGEDMMKLYRAGVYLGGVVRAC